MSKINNKGQSLVLFIAILPLFIMLGVYLIDVGFAKYSENKLNNVCKLVLDFGLDKINNNPKDQMVKILYENEDNIKEYNILVDNNNKFIKISVLKTSNAFLGNIVGKNIYKEKCSYTGSIKDGKKHIERDD